MEKEILFADKSPLLRKQLLEDNCDEMENTTYTVDYSEEQMSDMRRELSDLAIDMDEKNEARKPT